MNKKFLATLALLAVGTYAVAAAAATNPAQANFNVKLTINSACTVSTNGDITLGPADANSTTNLSANATNVSVICSKNTSYTIGLQPSDGNLLGTGVMKGTGTNSDTITYALQDSTGAVWGDTVSTNRKTGVVSTDGTTAQKYTPYVKVLGSALNVTPDSYTDNVTVNVYY